MPSIACNSSPNQGRRQFLQGLSGSLGTALVIPARSCATNETRVNKSGAGSRLTPFHWVDVFAAGPLAGNPLVVVVAEADLAEDLMRRIAREFNQSETTFLLPATRSGADWRLRSITAAGAEVFGAGHNALGAWWWLADAGKLKLAEGQNHFHQQIGDQVLPVTVVVRAGILDSVSMDQQAPRFLAKVQDLGPLAAALGLQLADIASDRMPAQVVFTGAHHLLVPIKDRRAVDRITPDARSLLAILAGVNAEGCYVFSLDPPHPEGTAYARFFNPTVGIWEDPATGTAAGPLAAALVVHGLAKQRETILIEQGTAMGRTSLIRAKVLDDTVRISGRGVLVASGELRL